MSSARHWTVLLPLTHAAVPIRASGQDAPLNIPVDYRNSLDAGVGGGFSFGADAPTVSATLAYSRNLADRWGLTASVGWDREWRKQESGDRKGGEQLAFQAAATFKATERLGLAAGFARTFLDREDGAGWKGAGPDDWAVGAGVSYSFPLGDRTGLGPSLVVAYDLDNKEWRMESEVGFSYAF